MNNNNWHVINTNGPICGSSPRLHFSLPYLYNFLSIIYTILHNTQFKHYDPGDLNARKLQNHQNCTPPLRPFPTTIIMQ